MERRVGIILIGLLVLLLMNSTIINSQEYLFQMDDPQGDEYGPGTYIYPTNQQFAPFEGLFDLLRFGIKEERSNYLFTLKFAEITNPWHAKYGFSHQLIQIYIDNAEGGDTTVFKRGANIKFSEEAPWNKLIKVNGWNIKVYDYQDNPQEEKQIEGVEAKVLDDEQTIHIKVPKDLIGGLKGAKYYVLIGSLDGFSYDNYRPVVEEVSEWKFGGGTNSDIDPNVIDILVPEGKSQREVLGNYNLEDESLATVYSVGGGSQLFNKLFVLIAIVAIAILGFNIVKYRKELIKIDE